MPLLRRRKVISSHAALYVPAPGGGGGPLIASASAISTGASTGATTGAINTTGANFLVVALGYHADGAASAAVSDSKGNTWTAALTGSFNVSGASNRLFYCANATVGSGHTFSVSGTGIYAAIAAAAFSDRHATPFDNEAGGIGTGATASAGAGVTPSNDNSLVIASLCFGITAASISGGFTIAENAAGVPSQSYGVGLAYLLQTTATAADPDWTIASDTWAARIATFKPA